MAKYQVGDIKFEFNYIFSNYFKNNIEAYKIDDCKKVNHVINVKLIDSIDKPITKTITKRNPLIINNENERLLYYKKNNEINILIKHDYNYNNIDILLNKSIINNLPEAEYIASGIVFIYLSMYLYYLPIHATAIKVNNDAILFIAPSGTGKSTHANYWMKLYPNAIIINDDKPLLKLENNELFVYGSPFSGEHRRNTNLKVKLKTVVLLNRGLDNKIEEVKKEEKVIQIIKNTLNPKLDDSWDKVIPIIDKLSNDIKFIKLEATNSEESAKTIYEYLYK